MKKTRKSPSGSSLQALMGGTLVIRKVRGEYQLICRPDRPERKATPRQAVRREKFLEATQYSSHQMKQPEAKALYATGITQNKHTSYLVAIADYLNAPEVKNIDASRYQGIPGGTIRIHAIDDFMVTKVTVKVTTASGIVIERGEATADLADTNTWTYTALAANAARTGTIVQAIAYDRPGHEGVAEVVL